MDNAALPSARTASVSGMGRWARVTGTGAAVALALCLATACTPEPAPTPTPTGFASADEAFAAAEATLRSYVEASNRVVISDPATFQPLIDLTTGDQRSFDSKRLSNYHADGYSIVGEALIVSASPGAWDPELETATLRACIDVSATDVLDGDGTTVVSADRPPLQSLVISLVTVDHHFLIDSIQGGDQSDCTP